MLMPDSPITGVRDTPEQSEVHVVRVIKRKEVRQAFFYQTRIVLLEVGKPPLRSRADR
jgi:hypothetical protein